MQESLINIAYIVASVLFIFGLKMLSSQKTARRGNLLSAVGMLIAVVTTLLFLEIANWEWILGGIVVGGLIGAVAAVRVPMTAMPEMVALFNGSGGAASFLVALAILVPAVPLFGFAPEAFFLRPDSEAIVVFRSDSIGGCTASDGHHGKNGQYGEKNPHHNHFPILIIRFRSAGRNYYICRQPGRRRGRGIPGGRRGDCRIAGNSYQCRRYRRCYR